MTSENNLPESFSTRKRNGKWQVLVTMENLYAQNTPTEGRWHPCENEHDAKTIANSPKAFHESHFPSRYTQELAEQLDEVSHAYQRNGMPDGAREFESAARQVREHLTDV